MFKYEISESPVLAIKIGTIFRYLLGTLLSVSQTHAHARNLYHLVIVIRIAEGRDILEIDVVSPTEDLQRIGLGSKRMDDLVGMSRGLDDLEVFLVLLQQWFYLQLE